MNCLRCAGYRSKKQCCQSRQAGTHNRPSDQHFNQAETILPSESNLDAFGKHNDEPAIKPGFSLKKLAIVSYRKQHGAFQTADDLALVKGIGDSTVEKNRDNIVVK